MSHRRTIKKGSFGGNIDDLLKHLDEGGNRQPRSRPDDPARPETDKQNVHDKLFEKSWQAARERAERNRFSVQ